MVRLTTWISLKAAIAHRLDDRPASPARPKYHRGTVPVPAGVARVEIRREAVPIGVGRMEFSFVQPQRVRGAEFLGEFVRAVRELEGHFLVRDGDVTADKAGASILERSDERCEIGWRNFVRAIAAGQPECLQPVSVDQRRTRMLHRKAGDKRIRAECFT